MGKPLGPLATALISVTLLAGCAGAPAPTDATVTCAPETTTTAAQPAVTMAQVVAALHTLETAPAEQRPQLVPGLVTQICQVGTPLVEGETLIFVMQLEPGHMLELLSAGPFVDPKQVPNTNLYVYRQPFPRLDEGIFTYSYRVDDVPTRDPWTKLPSNVSGVSATFRGPKAPPQPAEWQPKASQPTGLVETFAIESKILGDQRASWVYLPPGYDKSKSYPLLLTFDANFWFPRTPALPTVLDNLIAAGKIPPLIAVGVPNSEQRAEEYMPSGKRFSDHQRYLSEELLPYLEQHYPVDRRKGQTATLGFSNGGAVAYATAAAHPERYRGGVLFSPAAATAYAGATPQGMRFYITQGNLEAAFAKGAPLRDQLVGGNQVEMLEGAGGHDRALVDAFLPAALEWIWKE